MLPSPLPIRSSSPSRSPIEPRPYVEDELALDDSPVIVELRRRNSSADVRGSRGGTGGGGTAAEPDPLARYDHMIVREKERERGRTERLRARERGKEKWREQSSKDGSGSKSHSAAAAGGAAGGLQWNPLYPGHLIISNYQLAFIPSHCLTPTSSAAGSAASSSPSSSLPSSSSLLPPITVPLLTVSRISARTLDTKDLACISLRCKDFRRVHLVFTGLLRKGRYTNFRNAQSVLEFYAAPAASDGYSTVFAWRYRGVKSDGEEEAAAGAAAAAGGGGGGEAAVRPARPEATKTGMSRLRSAAPASELRSVPPQPAAPRVFSAVTPAVKFSRENGVNMYGKRDDETDEETEDSSELPPEMGGDQQPPPASSLLAADLSPFSCTDDDDSADDDDDTAIEGPGEDVLHQSTGSQLKVDPALPPPESLPAAASLGLSASVAAAALPFASVRSSFSFSPFAAGRLGSVRSVR